MPWPLAMNSPRILVASLTLSAAALVGIAMKEHFVADAMIPVPGDVPTIGWGSTDGVKMGDRITPDRALVRLLADADTFAQAVKRCAPVPMYQHEFDAYVSLTYNIGQTAFCGSTLARKLKAGDYAGACAELLRWDRFNGKPLPGLSKRRKDEYQKCMGQAQ